MKIAAIAKVIKDRGSCRLYRVHGPDDVETKFYIGTNSEIYSLEGFPKPWSEAEVQLSSCEGNDMDEKKNAPAEIKKVTITMSRPVAEAVAKACEMYLRLHMGQFEDLTDELCMAKFYAALENDSFADEEERDEIFHISVARRNIMQEEVDKLYRRYVLSAPLDYCMRIPYRAEQVWLAIRHALAWHDNPKGDYTVQYDKPLNRSDQPQPMVQLYEAPTEGKPACDGKCAKHGRC